MLLEVVKIDEVASTPNLGGSEAAVKLLPKLPQGLFSLQGK